jgi:hypothetical protein
MCNEDSTRLFETKELADIHHIRCDLSYREKVLRGGPVK